MTSYVFAVIFNIPLSYKACHLRNYFSQFLEASKFSCFHFRHRKQPSLKPSASEVILNVDEFCKIVCTKKSDRDSSGCCALLSVDIKFRDEFINLYNNMHWIDFVDDVPVAEKCVIHLCHEVQPDNENLQRLKSLIEFNPPPFMPQGNVGTPTSYFFDLIKTCELPSSLVSKLQLNFRRAAGPRKYSAVPFAYGDSFFTLESDAEYVTFPEVKSLSGHLLMRDEQLDMFTDVPQSIKNHRCNVTKTSLEEDEAFGSEDEAEDWERFESLHDDPYNVDRSKQANLKYENKVELVWEKGGSGLNFYTDESFWRKIDPLRKEEFFDEPSSFDWDLDVEICEPLKESSCSLTCDTRQLLDIQHNLDQRGPVSTNVSAHSFDKMNYGSQLLRRMGWKPGSRLGVSHTGLLSPLTSDGSLPPRDRTGLGYYGPRCCRKRKADSALFAKNQLLPRPESVYIRSVFHSDEYAKACSGEASVPDLLRICDDTEMKYRQVPTTLGSPASSSVKAFVKPAARTIILNPHSHISKVGISFVPGGLLDPNAHQT